MGKSEEYEKQLETQRKLPSGREYYRSPHGSFPTSKTYKEGSEFAVLRATEAARIFKGRKRDEPVTVPEIIKASVDADIDAPSTVQSVHPVPDEEHYRGGWSQEMGGHDVFDFGDRVLRALQRLGRKGLVRLSKSGRAKLIRELPEMK